MALDSSPCIRRFCCLIRLASSVVRQSATFFQSSSAPEQSRACSSPPSAPSCLSQNFSLQVSVSVSVSVSVCLCLSVSVFDATFTRSGSVPNGRRKLTGQLALHSSQGLCPVAERIVVAVYLASATLRSFRHSCSDCPPSLPAALVIARLYPASLRRSASSPGPNCPLSCMAFPVTPNSSFRFSVFVLLSFLCLCCSRCRILRISHGRREV